MNITFTRYRGLFATNEPEYIELHQFIDELLKPNETVDKIRNENNKQVRERLKKELPGYCFNGIFTTRSDAGFTKHSGIAVIDYDKIPDDKYNDVFLELTKLPYTLVAFRSPSGNGIKLLIRIPESTKIEHDLRLRTFKEYFDSPYMDLATDICRFCFVSYDSAPYVNEEATVFTPMLTEDYFNRSNEHNEIVQSLTDEDKIVKIITRFKRSTTFSEGERNKHIFNIASQFCEYGVSKQKCIEYCKQIWSADFEREGLKAIDSAYKIRKPNSKVLEDRELKQKHPFPFEIFPEKIRESIFEVSHEMSLNSVFLATAGLWTVSSLAGNAYVSEFGSVGKNILFCMMIAPVSVGKTPAFKAMCEAPLKRKLEEADTVYKAELEQWNAEKVAATIEKKPFTKNKPRRFHPFAVDGTTEGYIALSQDQAMGIGIYHDEAETILNAGAHKSTNDSISFFTQAFSGGRYTQIRADRDKERVVQNLNINLLMGTQPSRLSNIFTMDKIESGFASRFLMVGSDYIPLNTDIDPFCSSREMCAEWVNLVDYLYEANKMNCTGEYSPILVKIDDDAKELYRKYFKTNLNEANKRIANKVESYIIGTEAKMSNYLPRLIQVIAILNNPYTPIITTETVELGWKLYRYYSESTVNIIKGLHNEVETGLPADLELLYENLPNEFGYKEAEIVCKKLGMNEKRFRISLRRKDFVKLFTKLEHGKYKKIL